MPGPACYGRGGTLPTVTDADLVLGRIPADTAFSGLGTLDVDAAAVALDGAGIDAAGVVAVVNAQMEQALRTVSWNGAWIRRRSHSWRSAAPVRCTCVTSRMLRASPW